MKLLYIIFLLSIFSYADIEGLGFNSDNTIDGVEVKNSSTLTQGDLKVIASEIKDTTLNLSGKIKNVTIGSSNVKQSSVRITSATIKNVTITSHSNIDNHVGSVKIENSSVEQGNIYMFANSSLTDSNIKLDSSIESTHIENSTLSLCNFSLGSGATASGITADSSCDIRNSDIVGVNISQGNILYSN